jgi:hypothetical protein
VRLDLTTVKGDLENGKKLAQHFRDLIKAIETKFHYQDIQYVRVRTSEGGGVLHCILAIPAGKHFYVRQSWISAKWFRVHGAHQVHVKRMGKGAGDRRRVSKYFVNQYLAGQELGEWLSWSNRKVLGFSLPMLWGQWKKKYRTRWAEDRDSLKNGGYKLMLATWDCLLSGERVLLGNGETWSLDSIRAGWRGWACSV